jgi:hypothetical protein
MRKLMVLAGVVVAAGAGILVAWRRNPRMGATFVNERVNPFLVARGLSGAGASELGTLEHVGRRTGTRHLTPVHPVPTADGFRIVVPLGEASQWARNVLAAGHCRLQLHGMIHELDEPVLLAAGEMPDIATPQAWVLDRLGFRYLLLRRFAERPGTLEAVEAEKPVEGEVDAPVAAPA